MEDPSRISERGNFIQRFKSGDSAGSLFLDAGNSPDFSDHNSIIYGHHLRSGTMLSGITNYKSQEYYEEHPYLLLLTPDTNYVVELFAGHVASTNSQSWILSFGSQSYWDEWIREQLKASTFNSGIKPTYSDRLLTLSTCCYEFTNARYVLYGVLRPDVR